MIDVCSHVIRDGPLEIRSQVTGGTFDMRVPE